jgi:hypothetical protein
LLGHGAQQRVRQPERRERRIDDNLLGIGLGSNPFRGLPYRFRQMRYYLREFEKPALLLPRRGAAKRVETLTD